MTQTPPFPVPVAPPTRRSIRESAPRRGRRRPSRFAARASGHGGESVRQRAMSLTAMASAAILAFGIALPATAMVIEPSPSAAVADTSDPQRLSIATEIAAAPFNRGSYASETTVTSGMYAQTASTFVNYLGDVQWPFLSGVPISSRFGWRTPPCPQCPANHKGIDMNPGVGSEIQAIAAGIVREVSATDSSQWGVYAIIDHVVDGEAVSSLYAHMAEGSLALSEGQVVEVGDPVGRVGNTGLSGGPHLHLGLMLPDGSYIDPYEWLTARVGR